MLLEVGVKGNDYDKSVLFSKNLSRTYPNSVPESSSSPQAKAKLFQGL